MFGSAGRIPRLLQNACVRKTESVCASEDIFNSSPVLRPQKCSLHVVKQRQSDQLLSVRLLKGMYSTGIWNFCFWNFLCTHDSAASELLHLQSILNRLTTVYWSCCICSIVGPQIQPCVLLRPLLNIASEHTCEHLSHNQTAAAVWVNGVEDVGHIKTRTLITHGIILCCVHKYVWKMASGATLLRELHH